MKGREVGSDRNLTDMQAKPSPGTRLQVTKEL